MILLSHPTGNANIRNAAQALAEGDFLAEFWTSVSVPPEAWLHRWLPRKVGAELARRSFSALPRERIRTAPLHEVGRIAASRLGVPWLTRHEAGPFSVDAVYHALDRAVARRLGQLHRLEGVYAVEDGALQSFETAMRLGLHRFYELPIGYWRAARVLFREEAEREPAWAPTLTGQNDSTAKLERKDRELASANTVIVPSEFTRKTLELAPEPPRQVFVVPFGGPSVVSGAEAPSRSDKLRVLFVGSLGQRKGLSYLLEAMRVFGPRAELKLIGRKTVEDCAPLNEAVARHRWIPSLPHAEVLEEMGRHDVMVFPTLFEGFALVILEALSRGLPVITTEHSGGAEFIRDGENGFVVPIRSSAAIVERLEQLARDPAALAAMREGARATAARSSWQNYRARITQIVASTNFRLPLPEALTAA